MSSLTPLHHLPRPAQNLPYLIALAVAPLINLAISINSFHHFQTLSGQQLPINHWIFGVSKFVLSGILILLTINLLRTLWLGHHQPDPQDAACLWHPLHPGSAAQSCDDHGWNLLLQTRLLLSACDRSWALLLPQPDFSLLVLVH
jgi:hypothetical protein